MAAADFSEKINVIFFCVRIKEMQKHQLRIFAIFKKLRYFFYIKQIFVLSCFMLRITDPSRNSS